MTAPSLEIRRRLLRLVSTYPGLHLRELARQAELTESLTGYHLDALVGEGVVESAEGGGFRRFYAVAGAAPSAQDRELMGLLRHRVALQVSLILLDRGSATHLEITDALGLAKSTVSYHLARLVDSGLVVALPRGAGVSLRDPRRVERLLLRWEPPRDLVDRFASLCSTFYSRRRRR